MNIINIYLIALHYFTGKIKQIFPFLTKITNYRFAIKEGNVTYQCRFLQSEVYKRNWEAKRIVFNEFGTKAVPDPCRTIFQK